MSYAVTRSLKARYVRLEVRPETGLTVVIPRHYPPGRVPDLLTEKARWISGKLKKVGLMKRPAADLATGDAVPYLGRELRLVTQQCQGNGETASAGTDRLVVSLKAGSGRLALLLERWYRTQAARLLPDKANRLSARLGVTFARLTIRGQKTRWGSCSHRGNLSLNWKLVMAPEPVIDYVIIHELAHLKELNHTKRFWQVVAQFCPDWRKHRKWLSDHAVELSNRIPL